MSNFTITFDYPWLLLLLIPAFGLTFFLYFRKKKRYRRNRNRITSMILHLIVMTLCIGVLSGIGFSYELVNTENEILLLVDMSSSGEQTERQREQFILDAIDECDGVCNLGIVTFGFDQIYAAELGMNGDYILEQYESAELPDTSATDIAAALSYARTLFHYPETSKIVILSDGLETDQAARSVIRSIAADGTTVDTVCYTSEFNDREIQIDSVTTPEYNVSVGTEFSVEVTLSSNYIGSIYLQIYDNGEPNEAYPAQSATVVSGTNTAVLNYSFSVPGLHELSVVISLTADMIDTNTANNVYTTYILLKDTYRVLILESIDGESATIAEELGGGAEDSELQVTTMNINDSELPATVDELRDYDEVVLVNIASADIDERAMGFDVILNEYVYTYGGALLTFGGHEEYDETEAHAYNRSDMYGTLLQDMLPVWIEDYTPPIALMIVLDISGSMGSGSSETSKVTAARRGAMGCINELSAKDYCGIMTLASSYDSLAFLTPTTLAGKRTLTNQISNISGSGGTTFAPALLRAGQELLANNAVAKKHILLVTDGMPSDHENYPAVIAQNWANGITTSIVTIDASASAQANMIAALDPDNMPGNQHIAATSGTVENAMVEDVQMSMVDEMNDQAFTPTINAYSPAVSGISQAMLNEAPEFGGYFGTSPKSAATTVLMGEFVPVYAEWDYGAGNVASFLSSVGWMQEFLQSDTGGTLLENAVRSLLPQHDLRAYDVTVELTPDNYRTQVTIYTGMEEGQTLQLRVTDPSGTETLYDGGTYQNYGRTNIFTMEEGLYTIVVEKLDAEGTVISSYTTYTTFSYSKEYNMFRDSGEGVQLMADLAESGRGAVIEDAYEVLEGIQRTLHFAYDPRLPFIIAAIVLFLLDVAVRKFKFKWPHEIYRDYKAKRAEKAGS